MLTNPLTWPRARGRRYANSPFICKLAMLGLLACSTAYGANDPARIEVTGSRLGTLGSEGSSPVRVVTREELQRSGTATLREWLDNLPSNGGGSSDIGGSASFAAGASGASLRNMGKQATLILLNGRRVAPYPLADYNEIFTNLDSLPFEAIERIEILQIGGAALYGSDAIAGVIHIITRNDYRGVQGHVSAQRSLTSGRFGNASASLTAGFAMPGTQGGRGMANVSLYQRDALMWRDVLERVRPEAAELAGAFGSRSTYSWPGNLIGVGPLPGCAPENLANGLCMYDRYTRFQVIPAAQRANAFLTGHLPLGNGREGFAELLISRTRTQYLNAMQSYGLAIGSTTWGNPSTGLAQTFYYRGLPATHPLNPTVEDDAELRYRFIDGPNQSEAATTQYRALTGVRGPVTLGGTKFDGELALGMMGGRSRTTERGAFSYSGFHEVIGNDDPNQVDPLFFQRGYKLGQTNDPAVLARLFPTYGYRGEVRQVFVDGRLSGNIGRTAAGPVGAVMGVDVRHERSSMLPSAALSGGDVVGYGSVSSQGQRWVGAAFGELSVPLASGLQGEAAARLDKHGNSAAHLSPKLALRYTPAPHWLLRATFEGGFRAPNLNETSTATKSAFEGVSDPKRCPQAGILADDLRAQAAALPSNSADNTLLLARADNITNSECGAAVASIVTFNPALKPETSRSANLGLVFAPNADWRLAIDTWAIERRNEIGLKSANELIGTEEAQAPGTVNRLPLTNDRTFSPAELTKYGVAAGAIGSIVGRFENQFRTRNKGTDLSASTRLITPAGPLALKFDATYQSDYRMWNAERGNWGDNLSGRSGYPRWRLAHSATLTTGALEHSLRATTTGGTSLQGDFYNPNFTPEDCAKKGFTASECRTAGHTRYDYGLNVTARKGLLFSAQLYNVFNTRVPIAVASWLSGGGILPPTSEDAKGRMLRLSMEVSWP